MTSASLRRIALLGLVASGIAACAAHRAPAAERVGAASAPATLEGQLEELKEALVESFETGDWQMLELVSEGLRKAGLAGPDLEIFALSAERDAALRGSVAARHLIRPWGLACRALGGNGEARERLVELATAEVIVPPVPRTYRGKHQRAIGARHATQRRASDRRQARLAAALIGEKGMSALALKEITPAKISGHSTPLREAVLTVLAEEKAGGLRTLIRIACDKTGESGGWARGCSILGQLTTVMASRITYMGGFQMKVEGFLAGRMPAGLDAELLTAFKDLMAAMPKDAGTYWPRVVSIGRSMPGLKDDPKVVAALRKYFDGLKPGIRRLVSERYPEFMVTLGKKPNNEVEPF
jgi:hypothetical protein